MKFGSIGWRARTCRCWLVPIGLEIQKAAAKGCPLIAWYLMMVFTHPLARDLDIVLVDGMRPPVQTTTLPAGWLREPAIGLQRADAWVISGSMGQDDQVATTQLAGQPPLAEVKAVWQGVHTPQGEGSPCKASGAW